MTALVAHAREMTELEDRGAWLAARLASAAVYLPAPELTDDRPA